MEHLKDLPYSSGDDIVKATYMELVSTLKDLLAQHPIYREQLQSSYQFGSDFQDLSRLSDMAAALTSAQETDLQNVLAELSIPDRWGLHSTIYYTSYGYGHSVTCQQYAFNTVMC